LDASQIAQLSGLNRNTVNRYLKAIRERIAEHCELESPVSGEIEVDESFFGARRVKGKRGRVRMEKLSYLASLNGRVASIPRSFQTAPKRRCKRLSEAKSPWTA